jgi:glutathione S-transferase
MYTLYYMPGACSMAVHVVLNELNQPVKLENVSDPSGGSKRPPEFLKVNPRGNVPTLVDDGHVIREGGAIISYLLDKHNSPMLPKSGKERATALEWLMFCNATLHPAYGKAFFALKNFTGDTQEKILSVVIEHINKNWQDVEARLTESPYLCGKECTAADILLTVIANWSSYLPKPVQIGPKAKALFKKVIARPAYQKALTTEKVEYKAAA